MNNKGQVLVLFILILPIFILLLAALIEIGDLLVYQNKLEKNSKYIIEYGLDNIEDLALKTKLEKLNQENLNGKAKIIVDEEWIVVEVKEKKENVFSFINIPLTIEFSYKGTKNGEKTIITKDKED